jgi:hypothetical protein
MVVSDLDRKMAPSTLWMTPRELSSLRESKSKGYSSKKLLTTLRIRIDQTSRKLILSVIS